MKNHNFQKKKEFMFGHQQVEKRNIDLFSKEEGCKLAFPLDIFQAIYLMSNGHPCTDCSINPCHLHEKFMKEDNERKDIKKEAFPRLLTNGEMALILNMTKRQISKLRIPGTNEIKK